MEHSAVSITPIGLYGAAAFMLHLRSIKTPPCHDLAAEEEQATWVAAQV